MINDFYGIVGNSELVTLWEVIIKAKVEDIINLNERIDGTDVGGIANYLVIKTIFRYWIFEP